MLVATEKSFGSGSNAVTSQKLPLLAHPSSLASAAPALLLAPQGGWLQLCVTAEHQQYPVKSQRKRSHTAFEKSTFLL